MRFRSRRFPMMRTLSQTSRVSRAVQTWFTTVAKRYQIAWISSSMARSRNARPSGRDDEGDSALSPTKWTSRRKWTTACTALAATFLVTLNGTSITAASSQIDAAFRISDAPFPNSYWLVTSWSAGGALGIIVLLPLMEDLGVRTGFLVFYAIFLLMIVPQAVAQNFATLVVTRFFSGGCAALLANTISSMIPDMWATDEERNLPISLYILMYLLGSTIGPPIFAGALEYLDSWRWIFYIQLVIYGSLLPLLYFLLEETRIKVLIRHRNRHQASAGPANPRTFAKRASSILQRVWRSATRPLFLVCTEPVLFAITLWSAFSFGTVFFLTQSVAQVYHNVYGWSEGNTNYTLIAVSIGEIVGWLATLYGGRLFRRNEKRESGPVPEARLYIAIPASVIGIVGGMFIYAWAARASISWVAPTIGLGLVGFGIQVVVFTGTEYITDLYSASSYVGSAISAVAAGESIVAGFLPLSTERLYTDLHPYWAGTLLGMIALLLSLAPVLFVWRGKWFRERSPFMLAGGAT